MQQHLGIDLAGEKRIGKPLAQTAEIGEVPIVCQSKRIAREIRK